MLFGSTNKQLFPLGGDAEGGHLFTFGGRSFLGLFYRLPGFSLLDWSDCCRNNVSHFTIFFEVCHNGVLLVRLSVAVLLSHLGCL